MAYTTIDDPSAYFTTTLWTGAGGSPRAITNDANSGNFQPDFVWTKGRNEAYEHQLYDSSRGAGTTKGLTSLNNTAEGNYSATYGYLSSFDSNGFTGTAGTSGQNAYFDTNAKTYVAWQWKVNGGTTTSLTSNINSVCQVNQDAGISIVKYTCTGGGNGQSVQHGLGLVPQVIITKNRTDNSYSEWITYHHILTKDNFVKLNSDAPSATNSPYNGANPTSSTYNVSIDLVEQKDYVSYVFAPIQGYSKFGKYVGTGNANGPFVYTGFKPAFVMIKPVTNSGYNWVIMDSARNPTNTIDKYIWADLANAEYDGTGIGLDVDFLSNGFKLTTSRGEVNLNTASNIYMAFAENPLVTSTGIPTTAR
jgi:hypothetical protein